VGVLRRACVAEDAPWRKRIQTANSKSARKKKKGAENAERAAVPSRSIS
jgi:hypothetical protein